MAGGYAFRPLGVFEEAARWREVYRSVNIQRQALVGVGVAIDSSTGTVTSSGGAGVVAFRDFTGAPTSTTMGAKDFTGAAVSSAVVVQGF